MRRDALREQLQQDVAEEVARWSGAIENDRGAPPSDEDRRMFTASVINRALQRYTAESLRAGRPPLADAEEDELRRQLLLTLSDPTAPFAHLLELPNVTDISIQGWADVRTRSAEGYEHRHPPFCGSDDELIEIFQRVARRADRIERSWTPTTPVLDLYLERYQARVAGMAWVNYPVTISIRLHPMVHTGLEELVARGMMDAGVASFLRASVRARRNTLITGGTGTGKTTLMRAVLHECDPDERLFVIESEPELHLDKDSRHNQVVVCVERPANAEGRGRFTIAEHAWAVKRHNPDRIVVGEVRGAEIVPMLEAMSLGVDGSIGTIHSRDTASVFPRMAVFARQAGEYWTRESIYELAAIALDFVVLCRKDPRTGFRTVAEIRHIERYDLRIGIVSNPIFIAGSDGRATPNPAAPLPLALLAELADYGYEPGLHSVIGAA